jgi:F-box interacting protein
MYRNLFPFTGPSRRGGVSPGGRVAVDGCALPVRGAAVRGPAAAPGQGGMPPPPRLPVVARSLTSDSVFAKAHSSRHPLVAGLVYHRNGNQQVQLLDTSGNIVKRTNVAQGSQQPRKPVRSRCYQPILRDPELSLQGDLVCVSEPTGEARVLNVSTGAVTVLPAGEIERTLYDVSTCLLGRVPSTGEYNVFRIHAMVEPTFDIATLGGDQRWKVRPRPPTCYCVLYPLSQYRAVVSGVVYFLLLHGSHTGKPCSVASFDLATEQWRPRALKGPGEGPETGSYLGLDELNGCLVCACRTYKTRATELWFLEDQATGLWTKRYSLPWFDRHGVL